VYIENGRVLNVFSGEVLSGAGVAVAGGRIAYVGPSRAMIGPGTVCVDAGGGVLVPGYIDPHCHFDFIVSQRRLAEALLPLGTTALISDPQAMITLAGAAGYRFLKQSAAGLPFTHYYTVPVVAEAPALGDLGEVAPLNLSDDEFRSILAEPEVVGTSEYLPWHQLLEARPRDLERLDLARQLGKLREGHTPGASYDKLQAVTAAGITGCHEALTATEALERLRAGLYVMLRHGPVRADLPALVPLVLQEGIDRSRLMLAPDWILPTDLVDRGHMDYLIRVAMEHGVPPVEAYRMATLNPARYFRIEDERGAIAPGRTADILCLDTLTDPRPRWTMVAGRIVARDGRVVPHWMPESAGPAPQLPPYSPHAREARPEDFHVPAGGRSGTVRVNAISLVNRTVTRPTQLDLTVDRGLVSLAGKQREVLKVAVPRPEGGFAVAFLVGFGCDIPAFASSLSADPFQTIVLGSDDGEMAQAYNRLVAIGGGFVAMEEGRIVVELPCSEGGMVSYLPVPEIAARIRALNRWATERGSAVDDLFITHHFLTTPGVPFVRMTPWGIYHLRERTFLPTVAA